MRNSVQALVTRLTCLPRLLSAAEASSCTRLHSNVTSRFDMHAGLPTLHRPPLLDLADVSRPTPEATLLQPLIPAAVRGYETHIPLSSLQRLAITVMGSIGAALHPGRADLVAAVGETTGYSAAQAMRKRMMESEEGRRVLQDRPRVTDETLRKCRGMGAGTFGAAYAEFMGDRGFAAGERPPVRFLPDPELAYIIQRSREVHDFWHVLFDCHTNVFGELALKALEFVQTGIPMTAMAVAGAQWRLAASDRHLLMTQYLPWAARAGSRCTDLMSVYYEEHFEEDLESLRQRWRIVPAPQPPGRLQPKWVRTTSELPQGNTSEVSAKE